MNLGSFGNAAEEHDKASGCHITQSQIFTYVALSVETTAQR